MAEKEYIEKNHLINIIINSTALYNSTVLKLIKIEPTADVQEVRHGKWEQCFEDYRKQIEGDKCSVCNFEHYGTSIRHYYYCPNCGAKMDKE